VPAHFCADAQVFVNTPENFLPCRQHRREITMLRLFRRNLATLLFVFFVLTPVSVWAQTPVFGNPKIKIDQDTLVRNCKIANDPKCFYKLIEVLNSGGDFWTTPFTPYDPVTKTGDGYGEGVTGPIPQGPRSAQRHAFNSHDPTYRFLRMNGLDSQSCFECHNSTGSEVVDSRGALIRKAYGTAGSAGSNSNAFINPLFPIEETLFIRQPPAVFGSGYQQAVGDEMTVQLWFERTTARQEAMAKGKNGSVKVSLIANGIPFGTFTTTYVGGTKAAVKAGPECKVAADNPTYIGGVAGFSDDVTGVQGVSCDLVIRPLQWKGVASSLRHFVRDALDFHQSMQAFEKVGLCDCDKDGKGRPDPSIKGSPDNQAEVSIGDVTAITSFVAMTRPPVQLPRVTPQEQLGEKIFFGDKSVPGLSGNMCANCHVRQMKLRVAKALIEWPTNSTNEFGSHIDPLNDATWPISRKSCPAGKPTTTTNCPMESLFPVTPHTAAIASKNQGSLVTPSASSSALSVVQQYKIDLAILNTQSKLTANFSFEDLSAQKGVPDDIIRALREPIQDRAERLSGRELTAITGDPLTGTYYVLPLSAPASDLSPLQLPRLPSNPDDSVDVPLLSDLKRHHMGTGLIDPITELVHAQGTDVENINNLPDEYLTRPLWGVADTGPWLHDGRALTLRDAILMHGDSKTHSEAGPVIDVFAKLTPEQQDALVQFLLTLRLPPPGGFSSATTSAGNGVNQGEHP
jgi:hypothetical protein